MERSIELNVNGESVRVVTSDDRLLLDVLREDLGLTGTKYGCGEGECGACTVLLDESPIRSCSTTVIEAEGSRIRTIEGLAIEDGVLHPVQRAFLEKNAMQCGYCVPGQIMNAVGLLLESPNPSRGDIVDAMDGNLCRCCNYPDILAAVERAVEIQAEGESR